MLNTGFARWWYLVVLFVLSSCGTAATAQTKAEVGESWQAVLAAAKKEGKVLVYGAPVPAVLGRLKAEFDKAHPGIIMEFVRIPGSVIVDRVDEERRNKADGADVLITTEIVWLQNRAKEGLLKAPSGPASKTWPAEFVLPGSVSVLALEPIIMSFNSKLVKTPVTAYRDLLRPDLKGRIGTSEPSSPAVVAWYDWLDKNGDGPDFLAKLATQNLRVYPGSVPSTQAVVAGEILANTFSNLSITQPLIEQGAPVKSVIPKPSFGIRYGGTALGWAHRPNAALVAIDYLMSPRGQGAWVGNGEAASPLPNIPRSLDASSISPFDPTPYTPAVVKTFRERWAKLFRPQ